MAKRQRVTVRQVTDSVTWARDLGHERGTHVELDQLQCQCTHVDGSLVSRCEGMISEPHFRSGYLLCRDCRPSLDSSTAVARQMFVPHCDVSVSAFIQRFQAATPPQRATGYRCIHLFNASLAPQCRCVCPPALAHEEFTPGPGSGPPPNPGGLRPMASVSCYQSLVPTANSVSPELGGYDS